MKSNFPEIEIHLQIKRPAPCSFLKSVQCQWICGIQNNLISWKGSFVIVVFNLLSLHPQVLSSKCRFSTIMINILFSFRCRQSRQGDRSMKRRKTAMWSRLNLRTLHSDFSTATEIVPPQPKPCLIPMKSFIIYVSDLYHIYFLPQVWHFPDVPWWGMFFLHAYMISPLSHFNLSFFFLVYLIPCEA